MTVPIRMSGGARGRWTAASSKAPRISPSTSVTIAAISSSLPLKYR